MNLYNSTINTFLKSIGLKEVCIKRGQKSMVIQVANALQSKQYFLMSAFLCHGTVLRKISIKYV